MTDVFDVSGRTIIVTGGAGLLGYEYGRALVDSGADVVLADMDEARAQRAAACCKGPGTAVGIAVDVTNEASVANLVQVTLDRFKRIDGLVNNAALDPKFDRDAIARLGGLTFENYPLELWNRS